MWDSVYFKFLQTHHTVFDSHIGGLGVLGPSFILAGSDVIHFVCIYMCTVRCVNKPQLPIDFMI